MGNLILLSTLFLAKVAAEEGQSEMLTLIKLISLIKDILGRLMLMKRSKSLIK